MAKTKKINTCSSLYTPQVMKTFKNPRNYGKIKNADGIGKVGNIVCGDTMWLYIKVEENRKGEEIIKDIKFETFGCVAAISTSSTITGLAKGRTIKEATMMIFKISHAQKRYFLTTPPFLSFSGIIGGLIG